MAAAADITATVLAGITSLGVPWWGWAALLVMVFFGLLVPKEPAGGETPEERLQEQLS